MVFDDRRYVSTDKRSKKIRTEVEAKEVIAKLKELGYIGFIAPISCEETHIIVKHVLVEDD